jgi:hypothetical protein
MLYILYYVVTIKHIDGPFAPEKTPIMSSFETRVITFIPHILDNMGTAYVIEYMLSLN